MSIFSDYKVGALSDVEFHNACVEMNAQYRWEREHMYDDLQIDLDEESEEEPDDQPCKDAISREDVIKLVECSGYDLQFRTDNADMCDDVRKLPSVQPSRKGHWRDYSEDGYVECPFCEHATNCEDNIDELHYCFYCGAELSADMRGDTE